jgi:hypothetical protein
VELLLRVDGLAHDDQYLLECQNYFIAESQDGIYKLDTESTVSLESEAEDELSIRKFTHLPMVQVLLQHNENVWQKRNRIHEDNDLNSDLDD